MKCIFLLLVFSLWACAPMVITTTVESVREVLYNQAGDMTTLQTNFSTYRLMGDCKFTIGNKITVTKRNNIDYYVVDDNGIKHSLKESGD